MGIIKHNQKNTKLYKVWVGMRARCRNKTDRLYKYYGGRGISVCDLWKEYLPFMVWAYSNGYSENLEIDRIDNDGNYSPENCRIVTSKINNNNKRNNIRIRAFGEEKTAYDWSVDKRCNVKQRLLTERIRLGMPPEKAITMINTHIRTSRYTGVSYNNKIKKYISRIDINGKTRHLGCFRNEICAATMYNIYSHFNFIRRKAGE